VLSKADASRLGGSGQPLFLRFLSSRWPFLLLLAISGAIGGAVVQAQSPTMYQAESVVTAVSTTIPTEEFEFATTLFESDPVLQSVIDQLGLAATPDFLLANDFLDSESFVGGGLKVISRSEDPQQALELANAASESFASNLETIGLGTFSVLPAEVAVRTSDGFDPLQVVAQAGAGVLLAIAMLALLYLIRQPVLSVEDAGRQFSADVAFSAWMQLSRYSFFRSRRAEMAPEGIVNAIWRRAQALEGLPGPVCFVLVERKKRGDQPTRLLLDDLGVDHWTFPATHMQPRSGYWVGAREDTFQAMERAAGVVAIVSEGAQSALLREVADELTVLTPDRHRILVFMRGRPPVGRRGTRRDSRSRLEHTHEARDEVPAPETEQAPVQWP
jgi:capsular polysaccharide biosynthesis protein